MRIRRGLSSRHLPCGCLVGIYETYDEETVAIVDVRGAECRDGTHVDGNTVPMVPSPQTPPDILDSRHR
jgi:hypothetical protein